MKPERSLATVLFTDIVGSTERAAELRDTGWRDLRQEHDRRIRRELKRFGGHEINTAGDSFLATFERPARAIACAGAIRAAVRELRLEVRAGLHMGEVEGSGRDLGGLALHIGARVAAQAGAGEILVSSTVHDALAGSAIDFEDRGVHPLKGVPGEWRLFAVTGVPEAASEALPTRWRRTVTPRRVFIAGAVTVAVVFVGLFAARRETGPALTPEEALAATADPGIAVAPFTVNDPELNSLREDMVVLLSMHLDGVAGLRAISSRTMLARWEQRAPETANPNEAESLAIAGDTGARYGVIGSVVKIGPEVLLTADVFEIRSHKRLGSARAQGSVDDLWTLVDRLSIEIIKVIKGGEEGAPQIRGLASVTTDSLEALKAYLRGEELYRRASFEGATREFIRAVEIDSTFALAALQLLRACGWVSRSSWGPACETAGARVSRFVDRLPEREAAYFRAGFLEHGSLDQLELRRANVRRYPDDPEAWFQLGDWYYHHGGEAFIDPSESRKAFARSIALAPGTAPVDAYLHLIDAGFQAADSARVAEWLQAAGRYTAGGDWLRAYRLTYVLAFGDSAGAARARAEIASDPAIAWSAVEALAHPRFLPLSVELLAELLARDGLDQVGAYYYVDRLIARGQLRSALVHLGGPAFHPEFRGAIAYRLHQIGMTLPPDWLSVDGTDEVLFLPLFYAGAYAADQARWTDHRRIVEKLRAHGRQEHPAEAFDFDKAGLVDSLAARYHQDAARALEAYALWRRGHAEEAERILQAQQRRIVVGPIQITQVNRTLRGWLAEIAVETGDWREAARYYRSLQGDLGPGAMANAPYAAYELGRVYTELGDRESARESYEYALLAWRNADPDLRPRIQAAREALAGSR